MLLTGLASCTAYENNILISPTAPSPDPNAPKTVLPLEVDLPTAEAFVRAGFGLEPGKRFQATSFVTTRLRTVQAQPLVRLLKSYGDFEGDKVAEGLAKFRGRVSAVEFGRSRGPILYIELPYWTHQREETIPSGPGTRISEKEHRALVAELRDVFVTDLKASEFTEKGHRVFIWWR